MKPIIYLHDGTFEGMLHAVALAVKSKKDIHAILPERNYSPQLFDQLIRTETDTKQANRLFVYLHNLYNGSDSLALHAFLSEDHHTGIHIYHMVRNCIKRGPQATRLHTNDSIRYLNALTQKVRMEAHRLEGLIRFRILDNELQYAPFEPRHNVIGFLAGHFKKRLENRRWILHDILRDQAIFWNAESLQNITIDQAFTEHVRQHAEIPDHMVTTGEHSYQILWNSFHSVIANRDRENTDLQRQLMPKQYWKYLVEMRK